MLFRQSRETSRFASLCDKAQQATRRQRPTDRHAAVTCLLLSRPDFELDLTQKAVSDEEVYDGTETIFCGRDYSEAA